LTAGGSSIPEVRRLLAVLAAGKRAAEIGTALGLGAEALASTAREVVTVEVDPERAREARERLADRPNVELLVGDWAELLPPRGPFERLFMDGAGWKLDLAAAARMLELVAPGGLAVVDDLTPGYWPDPVRDFFFGNPDLVTVEILTTPETAALVATRVAADGSGTSGRRRP
jgi:predicted O-methyltransferase YrrM